MKILTVCQYYYPEQFRINDICEELVKQKDEITVLTGLPNYPTGIIPKEYRMNKKRKEIINGVKIRRCWEIGRKKGILYRILNYVSYMVSASWNVLFLPKDYEAIYIYQLSPVMMAIPGIIYKKLHKKKLILYCLDLWPESITTFGIRKGSFIYNIVEKISNCIYNQCDVIAVSSEMFIENLTDRLKKKKEIIYLPQYSESIFKRSPKLEKDTFDFVFAGNIGKAQSVDTIIKAGNILKKNTKIKLHIVGDGVALQRCKDLVQEMHLENVFFYGRKELEKMQVFYDLADAMLVTLSSDDFACKTLPGKVQTCMATGKPIIAAAGGETQQVINKAQCGLCSKPENEKELANNILKFINLTLEEKKTMSDNAYRYYQENFRKEIFINKIKNLFRRDD